MRRLLCALLLVGCPSAPLDPDPTPAPTEAPSLRSPDEAVDLDPDDGVLHVALVAAPTSDGPGGAPGYAYNGQVPGPTLRAQVGDTLIVDLQNDLDSPTTIHWHGVHVPWEMDGVPWMLEPVPPGGAATLTFPLHRAGTFWYHPHFDTAQQVDRGLYGVLIVEDPTEPEVDDVVLVFDDAGEDEAEPGHHAHGTRLPDPWLVNGLVAPSLEARSGAPLRGRILNASNVAYLSLRWPGLRVIGGDQGLLPAASSPSALLLAPGDRAEVEWSVGFDPIAITSVPYSLHGGPSWGDPVPVLTIAPTGPSAAPTLADWPFPGGAPSIDPGWTDVRFVFQGDGDQWSINGERFPDVTIPELPLGAEAILEVRNVSPTEHPFHLHGHAFEVLSDGEGPATTLRMEDTVNVRVREVVRLRLVADNPGDWMAHCHLLPHAEDGMMTVLRVLPNP